MVQFVMANGSPLLIDVEVGVIKYEGFPPTDEMSVCVCVCEGEREGESGRE